MLSWIEEKSDGPIDRGLRTIIATRLAIDIASTPIAGTADNRNHVGLKASAIRGAPCLTCDTIRSMTSGSPLPKIELDGRPNLNPRPVPTRLFNVPFVRETRMQLLLQLRPTHRRQPFLNPIAQQRTRHEMATMFPVA